MLMYLQSTEDEQFCFYVCYSITKAAPVTAKKNEVYLNLEGTKEKYFQIIYVS